MPVSAPTVLCFGEILWDFLPAGLFPGGAPFNVANHLHQLGLRPHLVSAIGRDLLGEELQRRLRHGGIGLSGLTSHLTLPTGYVRAVLGASGDARYEIATGVAWDEIATGQDMIAAATSARALVFGSLAQRTSFNRAALDRLLAALPPSALRVFDVNLRPPHDDLQCVLALAPRATLLKLNTAEAARLADAPAGDGATEAHARTLATRTGCPLVCVTAGSRGAGLLAEGRWHWEPARPIRVRDTVGAGDAFLAGLLAGLLDDQPAPAQALARACRLGEFVAAHDGATPAYAGDLIGHPREPDREA